MRLEDKPFLYWFNGALTMRFPCPFIVTMVTPTGSAA